MNRIYRKVWNKSLGQVVVASELASSDSAGASDGGLDPGGDRPRDPRDLLPHPRLDCGRRYQPDEGVRGSCIPSSSSFLLSW